MMSAQLVELDKGMLEGIGSYCLRSKKKSNGYINKNKWLNNQFEQGLKYVQLIENKKPVGFIEYTEAEFSSRVVYANDYLVIHCLWVSGTGKGYGTKLINKCLEDARSLSKKGVAVVTNDTTSWTPSKDVFIKNNFTVIDTAPFDFELLVYKFNKDDVSPYFPTNWEERMNNFSNLTILRSFQCPYVEIATENILAGAAKLGIDVEVIDFKNREELLELSPTPYGIFAVMYKGELITFHRLTVHSVIKRLKGIIYLR
ncbi:MAG: GNAT family N-acetyltransferase [Bacillaceae bacterium]